MTKKEYLSNIATNQMNISRYRELAQRLREAATDTSVHYREIDVQKTPNYQSTAILVEQAMFYEQKADELEQRQEVILANATKSIAKLDDPVLEEVLTLRYISPCLSIKEICEKLHICRSQAYQLQEKAISNLELEM